MALVGGRERGPRRGSSLWEEGLGDGAFPRQPWRAGPAPPPAGGRKWPVVKLALRKAGSSEGAGGATMGPGARWALVRDGHDLGPGGCCGAPVHVRLQEEGRPWGGGASQGGLGGQELAGRGAVGGHAGGATGLSNLPGGALPQRQLVQGGGSPGLHLQQVWGGAGTVPVHHLPSKVGGESATFPSFQAGRRQPLPEGGAVQGSLPAPWW